jgi:hypothetical protein
MENKIFYEEMYGYGFGSSLMAVISTIDYCLEKRLIPYISIKNSNYSDPGKNCWNIIFHQPFNLKKEDIIGCSVYYNQDLILNQLNYDSKVRSKFEDIDFVQKYRNIVQKYLVVKKNISEKVDNFLEKYKRKKILGMHKRGRDHFSTGHAAGQSHKIDNRYIKNLIDQDIDEYDYFYLNSDESELYSFLKQEYPRKIIFWSDKSQFANNSRGLHLLNNSLEIKKKMLEDLMIEILILSKCDKQLLMNSNVSHMSLLFSNHMNYYFYDKHVTYQ